MVSGSVPQPENDVQVLQFFFMVVFCFLVYGFVFVFCFCQQIVLPTLGKD